MGVAALTLITQTVMAGQHAFALQHFFNCITDISNKDGGDHFLTQQQVDDCFAKEFPNNPTDGHSSGHTHSIIIEGFRH